MNEWQHIFVDGTGRDVNFFTAQENANQELTALGTKAARSVTSYIDVV